MFNWKSNNSIQYVPPNKSNQPKNNAKKYASSLIKSEFDRTNSDLNEDYKKILDNGCFYLPNFFCSTLDKTIFNSLKTDLTNYNSELVKWNKHSKYENPEFSTTFNNIVKKIADHFNVDVYQTRLNYYNNGLDFKTMHRDSHAYGEKALRENITVGASFGDPRELQFLHEKSGKKFSFPQNNGDVFAFTSDINNKFLHGVPKTNAKIGPRFSIIVWGRGPDKIQI
jgi:hypothetical protein